jgi:hypothetical protein
MESWAHRTKLMNNNLLRTTSVLIFSFIWAYFLVLGCSVLVVRLRYPKAWTAYRGSLRVQHISPDLVGHLRKAVYSDPRASENSLLTGALATCNVLRYPVGILFFAWVLLVATR